MGVYFCVFVYYTIIYIYYYIHRLDVLNLRIRQLFLTFLFDRKIYENSNIRIWKRETPMELNTKPFICPSKMTNTLEKITLCTEMIIVRTLYSAPIYTAVLIIY